MDLFFDSDIPIHRRYSPLGKTRFQVSRMGCDLSALLADSENAERKAIWRDCVEQGIRLFDFGFETAKSLINQRDSGRSLVEAHQQLGDCFERGPKPEDDLLLLFRVPAVVGNRPIEVDVVKELECLIRENFWAPYLRFGLVLDFFDQPHTGHELPETIQNKTPSWELISNYQKHWSGLIGTIKKVSWPTFSVFGIGSFFTQAILPVIHWQSVDFVVAHQHFGLLDHSGSLAVETFCGRHSIGIINDDICYGGLFETETGNSLDSSNDQFLPSEDAAKIKQSALMAEEYETSLESLALFRAMESSVPASTIVSVDRRNSIQNRIDQSTTHLPARPLAIISKSIKDLTPESFIP